MLHRDDPAGFTVIAQPSHAWLSGQLARAWGNRRFGTFEPYDEVCLAAEQHDIGWIEWEQAPTFNPTTKRPYAFLELPIQFHTRMWSQAGSLARIQSRYSALLVSMHGTGLYERRDLSQDSPEQVAAVREYLGKAHEFEQQLSKELGRDTKYAPHVKPEMMKRNQRLVAVWDYISLLICMGNLREQKIIERVPTARGETTIYLKNLGNDLTKVTIEPWPFKKSEVVVRCEARRLPQKFDDEEAMRVGLFQAEWMTIETTIQKPR